MSLLGSPLLDQAVPAGLGHLPLSRPCRAAGKEPGAGGTGSGRGTATQSPCPAARGEEGHASRKAPECDRTINSRRELTC